MYISNRNALMHIAYYKVLIKVTADFHILHFISCIATVSSIVSSLPQ